MRFRTLLPIAVAAAFAARFGVLAQGAGGTTSSPGISESQGNPPAGAPAGSETEPGIAPGGASAGSSRIAPDAFDQLDKDHDGFISREEAAGTNLARDFDKLDTNRDGRLSPDEVTGSATRGSSRASGPRTSDDRSGVGGRQYPPSRAASRPRRIDVLEVAPR
ncbi:MAG: hypothetical protein EPO20_22975 [Betaproteobacteria bacterium]|nr:MAG: hypothetical protein EPO20_22975 [Betaproteobacteria bacterium]